MRRWARGILFTLFFIPLVACQQQVCLISPETEVTLIEIVKWDTLEHVAYMDDLALVRKLIRELNSAETMSIDTRNIVAPEFKLLFFQENTKLFELGYYREVLDIGLAGRYVGETEGLYGVIILLPIR